VCKPRETEHEPAEAERARQGDGDQPERTPEAVNGVVETDGPRVQLSAGEAASAPERKRDVRRDETSGACCPVAVLGRLEDQPFPSFGQQDDRVQSLAWSPCQRLTSSFPKARSRRSRLLARAREGTRSKSQTAMQTFEATRLVVGAQAIGIARAAYEFALDYVRASWMARSSRPFTAAEGSMSKLKAGEVEGISEIQRLVIAPAISGPQIR